MRFSWRWTKAVNIRRPTKNNADDGDEDGFAAFLTALCADLRAE
jgi:hypothetical protein